MKTVSLACDAYQNGLNLAILVLNGFMSGRFQLCIVVGNGGEIFINVTSDRWQINLLYATVSNNQTGLFRYQYLIFCASGNG
jgi:hypothetical protein